MTEIDVRFVKGEVSGDQLTMHFADGSTFTRTLTEGELAIVHAGQISNLSIKPKGEGNAVIS